MKLKQNFWWKLRSANEKIPLLGYLVKALQPISVSREDSKNKLFVINEIKVRTDLKSEWPDQLLVFPEGTTTNRSCLITFKPGNFFLIKTKHFLTRKNIYLIEIKLKGAFIPGLPVQPVVVEYKNRLDTITWTWEGLTAMKVFFLTLCQFNNKLEITVSFFFRLILYAHCI